jgi:hypothetical protein
MTARYPSQRPTCPRARYKETRRIRKHLDRMYRDHPYLLKYKEMKQRETFSVREHSNLPGRWIVVSDAEVYRNKHANIPLLPIIGTYKTKAGAERRASKETDIAERMYRVYYPND